MIRIKHTTRKPASPIRETRTQGYLGIEPVRGQVFADIEHEHEDGRVTGGGRWVVETDPTLRDESEPESPFVIKNVSEPTLQKIRAACDSLYSAFVDALKEGGVLADDIVVEIPSYAELHPGYASRWKERLSEKEKQARRVKPGS